MDMVNGNTSYIPMVIQSSAQLCSLAAASSAAPLPHWIHQPQCHSYQIGPSLVLCQSATSPSAFPEVANGFHDSSQSEEIRPSRPRELPSASPPVQPPAGVAPTQTVLPSPEQQALEFNSYSTINDYANSFYACSDPDSSSDTAFPSIVPIHQPVHETQLSTYSELSANLGFLNLQPIFQNQNPAPPTCDVRMDYDATHPSTHIYHYEPNSDSGADRSNELAWVDVWPSEASASPFLWPAAAMSYATMAAQMYDALQAEAADAAPSFVQPEIDPPEASQPTTKASDMVEPGPSLPPSSPKHRGRKSKVRSPPRDSTTPRPASEELKRLAEPKMACLFCRERKIACGALKRGNEHRNCDQCSKRGLTCIFPRPRKRNSARALSRPHSHPNLNLGLSSESALGLAPPT